MNLMKIHANAISRDDVTKEFHFRLMKFTLQFGLKFNFPKLIHGVHGSPYSLRK